MNDRRTEIMARNNQAFRAAMASTDTLAWATFSAFPWGGFQYQEAVSEDGTVARVVKDGYVVVTPARDLNSVYRQYLRRVEEARNA